MWERLQEDAAGEKPQEEDKQLDKNCGTRCCNRVCPCRVGCTLIFFVISAVIAWIIGLIVPTLLRIGAFTDIVTALPERMNLVGFSVGQLVCSGAELSVPNVLDIASEEGTTELATFIVNGEQAYINGTLETNNVTIGDTQVVINENNISTWGIDDILLDASLKVSGRLSATAMRFGSFEIRDNILTNNAHSSATLLEDTDITLFSIFGNFLAIVRGDQITIYAMNAKELSTKRIWEKTIPSITLLMSSNNNIQVTTETSNFVFECFENGCSESSEFKESPFIDAFGDTWSIDEALCTVSSPTGDIAIEGDCSGAKLGITETYDVYVVVPKQNKVVIIQNNEEITLQEEISASSDYQPVSYTSVIMFIRNGRLQKVEF